MGFVQEKKTSAIEIHCILPLFSWPRRRCERHFFAYVHSFLHNNKWKMMPKYIINYNFRIHWASPTVRSNTNQLFLLAKSGPTEKCRFAWIGLIRFCVLIFHQEGFEKQKYGAGTKNQKTPKNTPITNCVMIIISTLVQQELQEKRKLSKKKVYLQFFLLLCDTYLTFWAKTAILKTVEKESMKNEKFISFFGSATTPW